MNEAGIFADDKLTAVGDIADTYSYAPIKAALNFGFLQRKEYVAFLEKEGYNIIDVRAEEMDKSFIEECEVSHMNSFLYIPLRKLPTGELLIAVADPFDEKLVISLTVKFKCQLKFVATSDLDITWLAHTIRGGFFVKEAVFSLMKKDPESSGLITFTDAQLYFIFGLIGITLILLIVFFKPTFISINLFASVFFLFSIVFKLYLALTGSKSELHEVVSKEEIKNVSELTLPVYTILLPVYKEDKLIRKLIWNLRSLDYPQAKLDVKLLIEEIDDKTLNAVRNLDFPANFEVIVVPAHQPQTKPKACNYGLHFSRGEYLAIYDAEDVPDSD
jgi:hypothetical protein